MPMRVWHLIASLGVLLSSAVALAQNVPPDIPSVISPLTSDPDPNGVNISDGQKVIEMPVTLSIPADPRLTFDRVQNAVPYILGTISHNDPSSPLASSWSAHFGGERSESFQCENDDVCTSVTDSGSTITYASRDVRLAGSGVFYAFHKLQTKVNNGTNTQEQRYATSVQYPDGEVISYTYDEGFLPGSQYPPCPATNCQSFFRPTRLDSNTGYYITIAYQYTGTDVSNPLWGTPAQAAIYSPSNVLIRRLVYSGTTITDYGNNSANSGGRTFTSNAANALGAQIETANASVTLPGEASPELTVAGSNSHGTWSLPLIDSVNRDGVAWTYSYANARGLQIGQPIPQNQIALAYDSVTVSGPNGYHVTYAMSVPNHALPTMHINSRTDALGHTTSFTYGSGDQLVGVALPEGNSVSLSYDDCGNVITKTSVAKAGSGLANLTESASYPAEGPPEGPCPTVLNYRPTSYTDARGHVFNYSYNTLGQLTQELAPAEASGVRRETDITYVANTPGISRRTEVRVCGQTSSCSGNAESRTDFGYFATGDIANSNLPQTVTQRDEATSATRVTTYTYDVAGRPTVIDGPLAGTGDAKYFQYDKFGRKIWEVGELAPNNLRLTEKFAYRDSDDKVINVQTGTVACTSGCDTAVLALTLLQQTDTTYDSRRYPIRENTYKTAVTPLTVTDRSFLDRGLAECTAVRMNLAALPAAAAHGACTLGTQGTQGADRITKNSYDNAAELTKVQKAYLTADQADYVTYTYTPNGKQEYVTDANGNKARFVYDGFDRLSQWQFPSKTMPGAVNTADFEQYGYDQNGNRVSLRKRDASTLTYTFDNLNRMTLKVVPSRADLTAAQTRDVYFGYDIAGRQLFARFDSAVSTSDGVTNSYNGFGDLLTSNLKMGTFAKTLTSHFDGAGRRDTLTHPDSNIFTYAYDNFSRLSGVYQGAGTGTPLDTFAYANNGLVNSRSEGSTGASGVTYSWDDINRLTSQSDVFQLNANNVAWTFGYNPASQITTETRSNDAYAQTLTQGSTAYVPNGLNQYASVGGTTYTYDANGNLTGDGTNAYTFDIENRLVKAVAGATTTNLVYDPLGRLFETNQGTTATTTRFLTDGDAIVLKLNSSNGVTDRYVHGSNAAADDPLVWYSGSTLTTKRWLHADHLGSIVAWTNSSGGSPTINTYDEYGVPGSSNSGLFQYTGQAYIPELKLYYYKARFYSPGLGRFLQTDPVGYDGGVNLYAYVTDDPVNESDTGGLCTGSLNEAACNGGAIATGNSGFSTMTPEEHAANQNNGSGSASAQSSSNGFSVPAVEAYYKGRASAGDPYAAVALQFGEDSPNGGVAGARERLLDALVEEQGGFIAGNELVASPAQKRAALAEYRQIRLELARGYANAVRNLNVGASHDVGVSRIFDLHREVFGRHGLPMTVFGGSPITGTKAEALSTSIFWCPLCLVR